MSKRVPVTIASGVIATALAAAQVALASWVEESKPSRSACRTSVKEYVCYTTTQLTFLYPATWYVKRNRVPIPTRTPMVYLSTERLHDPCHKTASGTSCGAPASALAPNGVFASWANGGSPRWHLDPGQGTLTKIGGLPARISVVGPDAGTAFDGCRTLGGDELTSVYVPRRITGNYYAFFACVRGPGLELMRQQVRTLLNTTRFPHG